MEDLFYSSVQAGENAVKSIGDGNLSKVQIIKTLDLAGMQPYLSSDGKLWIKQWNIATESFASPEEVDLLKEEAKMVIPKISPIEWVSKNIQYLRGKYLNQWVAICNNEVKANASTIEELADKIEQDDLNEPFITEINPEEQDRALLYDLY